MIKKSDKRIARQKQKANKQLKCVKQFQLVATQKAVPPYAMPDSSKNLMEYRPDYEDKEGKWSWGQERNWGEEVWSSTISPFLVEYEKKTWLEILTEQTGSKKKHIFYSKDKIISEAQKRLVTLQKDDFDSIFRFRLSGLIRLYGFKIENRFYLLWYDPKHKIYPSQKKHT